MERRPDDLFRVQNLSVLKSPMPAHLLKSNSTPSPATPTPLLHRPLPKQNVPAFGLSSLANNNSIKTPNGIESVVGGVKGLGLSPLGVSRTPSSHSEPSLPSLEKAMGSQIQAKNTPNSPSAAIGGLVFNADVPELEKPSSSSSAMALDFDLQSMQRDSIVQGVSDKKKNHPIVEHKSQLIESIPKLSKNSPIELCNWSIVIVPNNPNITKLDKSVTGEWIVLVGKRSDMTEMWHSSLITDRISDREICTSSGRIYRLEGPLDESAMTESGFSFETQEAFKLGFPNNWREVLIQEFGSFPNVNGPVKDEGTKAADTLSLKKPKKNVPIDNLNGLGPEKKDDSTDPPILKENINHKKSSAKAKEDSTRRKSTDNFVNKKSSANELANSEEHESPRRKSYLGIPRETSLLTPESSNISVVGQTRSGRVVVKPLPFWENKYFRNSTDSPLTSRLKRRWGG